MEAERLGHHVVDGVALELPATAKAFRVRSDAALDRRQIHGAAALGAATGLLILIGQWVALFAPIALLAFAFLMFLIIGIWQRRTSVADQRKILANHPWQVWPCHVVERPERARAGTTPCRVRLLTRSGAVVRSGKADLPTEVWNAMTDGVGTLWICGDLRRPYLVAVPGGTDWTLCHPEEHPPRRSVHITIRT
ncbi:hypothetical protein ACFC26_17085 [Kitasatospora purpeofusca]|uniref:hypothetical protein n=1 Tax=Kitasatospora purpeofusca TaxID=67352 RepID=UPI0035DD71D4